MEVRPLTPMKRLVTGLLLALAIMLPQMVLFWPSLSGRTLLMPLDVLRSPGVYLPAEPGHPPELSRNWVLSDLVLYNAPVREYEVSEVRAGRLPLWNPYNFCGAPLLANQSEVFSPFQVPCYFFPNRILWAWLHLLRAVVAGLGAWWFFRREVGTGRMAAALGAVCWPLSGPFFAWYGFAMATACVWLPWLLAGVGAVLRRPGAVTSAGLAAITALLLLCGDPGEAAIIVGASIVYGLFLLSVHAREWNGARPGLWARWLTAGAAGVLGIALSAPLNLPMVEYMGFSARVAARFSGVLEALPIGPEAFGQIPFHYFLGSSRDCDIFAAETNLYESAAAGAVGAILLFALVPLAWSERRSRVWAWFWAALAIVSLGFIANLPLLANLFQHSPFTLVRVNRMPLLAAWSLLTLAVVGAERLWRGGRPPRWLTLIALFATALVAGFMAWRAFHLPALYLVRMPAEAQVWFGRMYAMGALWSGFAFVALLAVRWIVSRWVAVAVGLAAVLELSIAMFGAWPQQPAEEYLPKIPALEALKHLPPGRVCGVGCLPPNLNQAVGFSDIRGYDGVDNVRLLALLRAANPSWISKIPYALTQWYSPRASPILHMLNLRYLVFRGPLPSAPPAGTRIVAASDDYWIAENLQALPRVFIPRQVKIVPESEMVAQMARASFDAREVGLSAEPLFVAGPVTGQVAIASETPGHLTIAYTSSTPALVVLADMWYPGWEAICGGQPLPVHRVNYALIGVVAPAGAGAIELRYRPASFRVGLAIAVVAVLILGMWVTAHYYRRTRFPPLLVLRSS